MEADEPIPASPAGSLALSLSDSESLSLSYSHPLALSDSHPLALSDSDSLSLSDSLPLSLSSGSLTLPPLPPLPSATPLADPLPLAHTGPSLPHPTLPPAPALSTTSLGTSSPTLSATNTNPANSLPTPSYPDPPSLPTSPDPSSSTPPDPPSHPASLGDPPSPLPPTNPIDPPSPSQSKSTSPQEPSSSIPSPSITSRPILSVLSYTEPSSPSSSSSSFSSAPPSPSSPFIHPVAPPPSPAVLSPPVSPSLSASSLYSSAPPSPSSLSPPTSPTNPPLSVLSRWASLRSVFSLLPFGPVSEATTTPIQTQDIQEDMTHTLAGKNAEIDMLKQEVARLQAEIIAKDKIIAQLHAANEKEKSPETGQINRTDSGRWGFLKKLPFQRAESATVSTSEGTKSSPFVLARHSTFGILKQERANEASGKVEANGEPKKANDASETAHSKTNQAPKESSPFVMPRHPTFGFPKSGSESAGKLATSGEVGAGNVTSKNEK